MALAIVWGKYPWICITFLLTIQSLAAIAPTACSKLSFLLSLHKLSLLLSIIEGQQQQHGSWWKNSAKLTAPTLGKISTKIMRSGASGDFLFIIKSLKTPLLNKISEFGNSLTSSSLFIGKFQNILTKPYVYRNKNLDAEK